MTREDIREINASARRAFGADISIMVARCKAWGNDDNCILVQGERHHDATAGFARTARGAKITADQSPGFMGSPARTYSKVVWA
ncbi:hypothetical protein D8I35_05475 [Corticibacter populi]|uniref:Uncharacterized protein n=1 Tax=Corticibacter populi TaxID=1550736 RepID=A0A3M6QZT4_9BURK|nr:hypothetical protein [Corticibacter populi]RMX08527.1 hypothetical protein D8I35_05475 [Corticibacter populi]RZS35845.1 hypothetical protein EV687_0924 [Corticibacter populi]